MALILESLKGVAHLYHPPVDKIVAQCFLERRVGRELPIVAWWGRRDCPDSQVKAWEDAGILPIDIGGRKYHNQAGSATEYTVREFGLVLTPAEMRMVEMINRNNREGYLKGFYGSMVWTLRELYEIPGFHPAEVMDSLKGSIHMFLEEDDLSGNDPAAVKYMQAEFADLVEMTAKCNFSPFTPGRLLAATCRLHKHTNDEIREAVTFWMGRWTAMKTEMDRIERDLSEVGCPDAARFNVAKNLTGIKATTDNRLLTKRLARHAPVLVVKNSNGHAVVSARGMDLTAFQGCLRRHESDRWHFPNEEVCLNGGPMYRDTAATVLPLDGLVQLLRRYPPAGEPPIQRRNGNGKNRKKEVTQK